MKSNTVPLIWLSNAEENETIVTIIIPTHTQQRSRIILQPLIANIARSNRSVMTKNQYLHFIHLQLKKSFMLVLWNVFRNCYLKCIRSSQFSVNLTLNLKKNKKNEKDVTQTHQQRPELPMVTLTWYAYTMHSGVCGGGVKLKTLTAIRWPGDDSHLTSSTIIESKVYVREIESSS